MSTTANGDVSLYYETFGAAEDPVLLLVNGLGSQCINLKDEFCEKFAARGFRVVRFDNRDVGLSSHLAGGPHYTVDDMAQDGFAVLDAVGAEAAHIAGWSMGGMIVQAMALREPGRVLSMTSVMSAPGPIAGERDPAVTAIFGAAPATTRDEAAERHLAGLKAWGSPACIDVDRITADSHAAYDRCWDPGGRARQATPSAPRPRGRPPSARCASRRSSCTGTPTGSCRPRTGRPPPTPSPAPGWRSSRAWATTTPRSTGTGSSTLITAHAGAAAPAS